MPPRCVARGLWSFVGCRSKNPRHANTIKVPLHITYTAAIPSLLATKMNTVRDGSCLGLGTKSVYCTCVYVWVDSETGQNRWIFARKNPTSTTTTVRSITSGWLVGWSVLLWSVIVGNAGTPGSPFPRCTCNRPRRGRLGDGPLSPPPPVHRAQ